MNDFFNILLAAILAYVIDNCFFYIVQNKYCKRYKGVCKNCNCWSCTRKKYIDEYKNGG